MIKLLKLAKLILLIMTKKIKINQSIVNKDQLDQLLNQLGK